MRTRPVSPPYVVSQLTRKYAHKKYDTNTIDHKVRNAFYNNDLLVEFETCEEREETQQFNEAIEPALMKTQADSAAIRPAVQELIQQALQPVNQQLEPAAAQKQAEANHQLLDVMQS